MNNNTLYQATLNHLTQILINYIKDAKRKRGLASDSAHWMESKTVCWSLAPKFSRAEVLDSLEKIGYKKKRMRTHRNKRVTVYVSNNWAKWNKCSEWNQIGFWN